MQSYLITDPGYYSQDTETFSNRLRQVLLRHRPSFALYRDKSNRDYGVLAEQFVKLGGDITKMMLHGDPVLASELNAYGVHLSSQQFDEIKTAKSLDLFTVISCHSERELLQAEELGADAATYSPVFSTPNKGEPKGLAELQRMVDKISLPIIALGGITAEEIRAVESTGCHAFASIRYFIEN